MNTQFSTSIATEVILGTAPEPKEILHACSKSASVSCSDNNLSSASTVGTLSSVAPMNGGLSGVSRQDSTSPLGAQSVAVPALALMLLAVIAVMLSRRRRAQGQRVRILESTSLGPKRSLVVAQMGDETLLIGSSESGLCLLAARPSVEKHSEVEPKLNKAINSTSVPLEPVEGRSSEPALSVPNACPEPIRRGGSANGTTSSSGADHPPQPKAESNNEAAENLARLLSLANAKENTPSTPFQSLLAESVEDQELRRKFAAGPAGRAR